ncbi:hypothetical protein J5X84_26530 [Streptosporangiaceae bacterium NEAU-GS5]|nr:hypothetical protein [Streptosporangiaceae bacterium NEAU-GS5]
MVRVVYGLTLLALAGLVASGAALPAQPGRLSVATGSAVAGPVNPPHPNV